MCDRFQGLWVLSLISYSVCLQNEYHFIIQLAPFVVFYVRRIRSSIRWFEVCEVGLIGQKLVHQSMEKNNNIKERLKTTQSRQKSYTNVWRTNLGLR